MGEGISLGNSSFMYMHIYIYLYTCVYVCIHDILTFVEKSGILLCFCIVFLKELS